MTCSTAAGSTGPSAAFITFMGANTAGEQITKALFRVGGTVVGITVMVSQLYVQLDEFSNSRLELRLEETALGAGCAIAVILLVLPLRTRRVLRVAMRELVVALERLVAHSVEGSASLRADARALDATYQAVIATAQPLRRNLFGTLDDVTGQAVRHAAAACSYARNLVFDVERSGLMPSAELEGAGKVLRSSL